MMTVKKNDKKPLLVLGVGSYLMGDEGVGVHIVQRLAEENLLPQVDILDGGTGGFHLMGILEQYARIILIDATIDGQPAGTIRWLKPKFASDFPRSMSTHDIGLRDVFEALQVTGNMPEINLVTISIAELQAMTIGLSPAVQGAADQLYVYFCSLLDITTAHPDLPEILQPAMADLAPV